MPPKRFDNPAHFSACSTITSAFRASKRPRLSTDEKAGNPILTTVPCSTESRSDTPHALDLPTAAATSSPSPVTSDVRLRRFMHQISMRSEPAVIATRESELARLESFVAQSSAKSTGSYIYVCGRPGTGKSACAKHMLRKHPRQCIVVNCMTYFSVQRVAEYLEQKHRIILPFDTPHRTCDDDYAGGPFRVVILDEIDELMRRDKDRMSRFVACICASTVRVCVIGISNSIDLVTDDVSDRILFEPYSAEKIVAIVKDVYLQPFSESGDASGSPPVPLIAEEALAMLARRVQNSSGDFRKVIDILCAACRVALGANEVNQIKMTHMVAALKAVLSSSTVSSIKSLSLVQKSVLATMISLLDTAGVSVAGCGWVDCEVLRRKHVEKFSKLLVGGWCAKDWKDAVAALEEHAVVQSSRDGRMLELVCDVEDARRAMEDHALCRDLMQ